MVVVLLSPFVPHVAEEMWKALGGESGMTRLTWPSFDPEMLLEDEILIVVQVNGKKRAEITVPADNVGDITGDMASRRGRVTGQEMLPGNMVNILAQVPLSEVANYNSQLKSVTGGQGSYSMELSHYEPTPPNIQQQVIAQYKKQRESE